MHFVQSLQRQPEQENKKASPQTEKKYEVDNKR